MCLNCIQCLCYYCEKKTLGYEAFINDLIQDIELLGDKKIPTFFKTLVGEYTPDDTKVIKQSYTQTSGLDKDILLTLQANQEQLRIIKQLDNYGAVLVQGPPGTGKTHTIANILGHLLSEGKRVLVTSHTEKALSVLKEKVYDDMQDPDMSLKKPMH